MNSWKVNAWHASSPRKPAFTPPPTVCTKSNRQPFRKPGPENAPFNNGHRSGTSHAHKTTSNCAPPASPLMERHSHTPSANPLRAATTPSGKPQRRSKKTTWAAKHASPSTRGVPPPRLFNWPSTTHSRALMRPGSVHPTHRSHSIALVAPCGVTPPTSPYSAPVSHSHAGTWVSPHINAPFPSKRSSHTRNTPTFYFVSSLRPPLPPALRTGPPFTSHRSRTKPLLRLPYPHHLGTLPVPTSHLVRFSSTLGFSTCLVSLLIHHSLRLTVFPYVPYAPMTLT